MRVFIQSIVGQILLNLYIGYRGSQALPTRKWKVSFIALLVLEFSVFLFGFIFRTVLPDEIMVPIQLICNTWYISMLYITLSLLVVELLRLSDRYLHWFPSWVHKNMKQVKLFLFGLVALIVSCLMYKGNQVVNHPVVRHLYLTLPKGSCPRDSVKIVMMADLHIGEMIGKTLAQRFVHLSNEQHPDMVVMVGDILDYESRFAEKAAIEEDLQQLKAPLGVYMVKGNHEYRANWEAKNRWFKKTGATMLVDSVVMPDSAFYLIGRDDYVNKKNRATVHELVKQLDPDKPMIMLDHQPFSFAEAAMNGIDLGLYGHTHNGQYWPYPLFMKLIFECPYGYYRKGNAQFYVTSGIGFAGPPYRIGTVSELVVLHIRFKD